MKNKLHFLSLLLLISCPWFAQADTADDSPIVISRTFTPGLTPPTPITVTGFSGEVARVLDFDLTVMGFKEVPAGASQYTLSGSNTGSVQARLNYGQSPIFSKTYSGVSLRAQAHRLADDIVLKITGINGIAETRIAYKGKSGRSGEIYVSDFDGANAQAVTHDGTDVAAPAWVPGKLELYYTSYKMGGYPNIFFQDLRNGERKNFAHYPGLNSGAAVAKDGRVAMVLGESGTDEIYVCNADGTGLKRLTKFRETSSPCWSPDGQWICFDARVNGRRSLYKVSPNGGEPVRIPTSGVSNPSEPDWSPDGKWITFTSMMGSFNVCVVPATGGSATVLEPGEDSSWAPNSRTVIFVRRGGAGRTLSLLDVPTKQVKDAARFSGSNSSNSQPSWAR